VFSGGDVARQLPAEAKRFASIDAQWSQAMEQARTSPNVLRVCGDGEAGERLARQLGEMRDALETCQKYLAGYLESKRRAFPRFYFVSVRSLLLL
jgi:dynein heavy chain